MGSPGPLLTHIQTVLHEDPAQIHWSHPRLATLVRGSSGLGLRVRTIQGKEQSFTLVTKVKEDCAIAQGTIAQFDRIVAINDYRIVHDSEKSIFNYLKFAGPLYIHLTVCSPLSGILNKYRPVEQSRVCDQLQNIYHSGQSHKGEQACVNDQFFYCNRTQSLLNTDNSGSLLARQAEAQKEIDYAESQATESTYINSYNSSSLGRQSEAHSQESDNCESQATESTYLLSDCNQNVQLRHDLSVSNQACAVNRNGLIELTSFFNSDHVMPCSDGRLSDTQLSETQLSVDGDGDSCRNVKRGNSQVSDSSDMSFPRRGHSKHKPDKKGVGQFSQSGSTDSPEREEMEPLHGREARGDPKYTPQSPAELSLQVPGEGARAESARALSMADIVIDPDHHGHPLPADDYRLREPSSCCPCASCSGGAGVGAGASDSSTPVACQHCGVRPGSSGGQGRKVHSLPTMPSPGFTEFPPGGPMSEEYGAFLLKNPQLAVWDGMNTHVVEIDKGSAKEFGFSYKVKVAKNQDTSVEIYTLVEKVERGGPARGKLNVGDWIRSVNSTPIQVPENAFTLINSSTKEPVLRLVIQRPVGLSQKLQKDGGDRGSGDPQTPSPQPQISSPGSRDIDPLLPSTHIPGIIEPKSEQATKVTPQNIYFHDSPPGNYGEELDSGEPPFPRAVKLPKVRLFLCGGEAEKCASFLLRDSGIELDFRRPGYTCADCSMATDCFGNVVISAPCSNLYSTSSQPNSYATDSSKSGVDARCSNCGSDYFSGGSPLALGTVVNVEMFVVPDDRLFHHCCNYLFTKSSIFILTFDGAKLLGSAPSEFARLHNLSHTIRSFVGEDAHIMSCGLLAHTGDRKNLMDEVRALFYTPYNSQLQNFNVHGPELINLRADASSESFGDNHKLNVVVWKVVTETIQRQRVIHPSLLVIDHLNAVRRRDVFVTEGQLMEIIRQKLPGYQLDVHQMILTYLIMNREILLGKAMPFITSQHSSIESLVLLDPRLLLEHLHVAIATVSDDKQTYNRTHSTGFIRSSILSDLLEHSPYKHCMIDFFESCGLIFKKSGSEGRSGGGGDSLGPDLFLPFFALQPSTTPGGCVGTSSKDWVLCLRFSEHVSTPVFWALGLGLVGVCDAPGSLVAGDAHTCGFRHGGLQVMAQHHKLEDTVRFICKREDKSSCLRPPDLLSWLWSACRRALDTFDIGFQLGAPCPYGDECRRGRGGGGTHVVDVRTGQTHLYCGEDRIDQCQTIRMWRSRELETISLPSTKCPSSNTPPPMMSPTPPMLKSPISNLSSRPFSSTSSNNNRGSGFGASSSLGKPGGGGGDVSAPMARQEPVKVMKLGWTLFNNICNKLNVHSPIGRDWRGLAGVMGLTAEKVHMYEVPDDPASNLLKDWSCKHNANIEDLVKLLRELEREDIISDIREVYPAPETDITQKTLLSQASLEERDIPGVIKHESEPVTQIGVSEVGAKKGSAGSSSRSSLSGSKGGSGGSGGKGGKSVTGLKSMLGSQVSEEDNCVGLGQTVTYNSLEPNTQMDPLAAGSVDNITPVEVIYTRTKDIPDS